MPQNNGTRGGTGRDPSPSKDPDTDPRKIYAEPVAEEPLGEVPLAGAGADADADADADAGRADSSDDATEPDTPGGGAPGGDPDDPRTPEEVRKELEQAQAKLKVLEAELAGLVAESERNDENGRVVAEYKAQHPVLKADEAGLELFRTAEITFLQKMLPEEARRKVEAVDADLKDEVDTLKGEADAAAKALSDQRVLLDEAKGREASATAELDRLLKPVDPVRSRLDEAKAIKTKANDAEESGDFALAYWLVMDNGRLQQRLTDDPEIVEPDKLLSDIKTAQKAQVQARTDVARLEPTIPPLEKMLEESSAKLETARSMLETRVLDEVSKLNPKQVVPA